MHALYTPGFKKWGGWLEGEAGTKFRQQQKLSVISIILDVSVIYFNTEEKLWPKNGFRHSQVII